ncbi:GNAT family N-acetyltransferase [Planococcus versutus]|uniref:GNAT family N-acetyltransferase n=1 Tax=Planococcus versutus TaxID=1302659 RepID=A0A1B1RX81_9BACL|nr:GNAT family protein [Planococcus versutus]ANU25539.1 GNAT family N-acetyltransferase [Planococcus versutus]
MNYTFQSMTQEQAEEIATTWHYKDEYSFYDMDADQEDLKEFLDAEKRNDSYFIVTKNQELIGFYSFNQITEDTIDIGLGMKPNLTGSGQGLDFLKAGLKFIESNYNPKKITLSVATFNQRAIKVYKKIGFKEVEVFVQATNGSRFEFLKMALLF